MSPPEAFPPELARVTLFRVFLPSTLFHETTGSSAIEGLWGTLVRGRTVCEGTAGGEGRGRAGPSATAQLPNPQGLGPESWSRIEPGAVTGAVYCSPLQSPARQEK